MRIAFAGDRDISVQIIQFIKEQGIQPLALLVSDGENASHSDELMNISGVDSKWIFRGKEFSSIENVEKLRSLNLDYIIGIHFPYIIKKDVLNIPKYGFLNLHPAFLPYNRGWHTPTWGILEKTPIGGTLHFMSEALDLGDIIHQKEIDVLPDDTANTLYARLKQVEYEVFVEAWPKLVSVDYQLVEQKMQVGTSHRKNELFSESVQKICLNTVYKGAEIIDKLRALTTSQIKEAAYFEKDGKKYRVQITIIPDGENKL